jgi:hypothetical protein
MTNTMTKSSLPLPRLLFAALALGFVALGAAPARADIPPSCDTQASLVTCAATDVGKPCQGGGQCFEISCSSGTSSSKIYKCDTCPATIEVAAGTCGPGTFGTACGDGKGTCGALKSYCATAASGKYACVATAQGTAGSGGGGSTGGAGATGSAGADGGADAGTTTSSGGGCDIAPTPKPGMIGLGLVVVGLVFFAVERLRRRRSR